MLVDLVCVALLIALNLVLFEKTDPLRRRKERVLMIFGQEALSADLLELAMLNFELLGDFDLHLSLCFEKEARLREVLLTGVVRLVFLTDVWLKRAATGRKLRLL